MSRSYKKFIVCKDDNSKFGKRLANKTVRRNKNVPDGAKFKRYFCSWNICDYRSKEKFYTAEQFRRRWFDISYTELDWLRRRFRSWKEAYRHRLRWYRMK